MIAKLSTNASRRSGKLLRMFGDNATYVANNANDRTTNKVDWITVARERRRSKQILAAMPSHIKIGKIKRPTTCIVANL